jgi:DNA ligase-1
MRSAFIHRMSAKPLARQVVPGPDGAESASAAQGSIRPRDSLFHWCGTVDAMMSTKDAVEQRALLEAYFGEIAEESIAPAVRFFAGELFAGEADTAKRIPWTVVAQAIQDLTRLNVHRRRARRIVQGDLSNAVAQAFAGRLPSGLAMSDVDSWAGELALAPGDEAQLDLLRGMLARLSAMEAKYLVSLIAGNLRIGMSRQQIEDALTTARRSRA